MAPDVDEHEQGDGSGRSQYESKGNGDRKEPEDEEEGEEEDEEPRLKYASLTKLQGPVHRNEDSSSAFLVAGDKMILGTHKGNIHILSLPTLQSLRTYHAHSASIIAVSISPFPPPSASAKPEAVNKVLAEVQDTPARSLASPKSASPSSRSPRSQPPVPATPSNSIYIATASLDGNVCVSSLVDPKNVLLRSFGRPVSAVALSPNYKDDRTYLSGGLAENLVLTVGGQIGASEVSSTTGGAAAVASGWLGTIGLGGSKGTDTILHSGEGRISTIQWSLSGKYVVWVNEQGIKIMRSNLYLETAEADLSWKRISHIDRPSRPGWEEMAKVWKPRVEWINEHGLESDEESYDLRNGIASPLVSNTTHAPKGYIKNRIEKLVVGWGGTIWIIDVHLGSAEPGKVVKERRTGRVEVVTILRTDCIISGVSLYTHNLLLVLAYITPEEDNTIDSTTPGTPRRLRRRQNALQPEMRIIDINTKEEICVADTLNFSRFETLSATDYSLGVLPIVQSMPTLVSQRGALEVIGGVGGGLLDAAMYPARLFSSGASVFSTGSDEKKSSSRAGSGIVTGSSSTPAKAAQAPHPALLTKGMKIFIQSPYDCLMATKPTISDHFSWLDIHEKYEEAWKLLDTYPEVVTTLSSRTPVSTTPSTPIKGGPGSLVDFFADENSQSGNSADRDINSQVEKEKRRIGEKWLQQLVGNEDWQKAGQVAGQVLRTSAGWEHWVWVFLEADRYEEITPFIPTSHLPPLHSLVDAQLETPVPPIVYEWILGHYISEDRPRLKELLERWPPELFDVGSIITAIEGKLRVGDVKEDTSEGGETGRDWRILMESLARLYISNGRTKDALRCYIKLQDAEAAMSLISEYHLVDAVSDDIPGLILLRVSKEQQRSATLSELEEASIEPIRLLVDEAHHGIVRTDTVISQLKDRDGMLPYLFFYLRALWNGETSTSITTPTIFKPSNDNLAASEGKSLVNDHADLAVSLFAEYSRPLLFAFLRASQSYTLELASSICESRSYIPELVYLLAKQGHTKRALSTIIDKLGDVSQAIAFAKEQDDPELWNDLLEYSMNKPTFIRGLLEEVGTAINPITLVRRIPEGLEIEGLREGLSRMVKEYELQDSVSDGVAQVLRGEVAIGMATLRTGQKRGVKFEVVHGGRPGSQVGGKERKAERRVEAKSGHCSGCGDRLVENEKQTVIGFPCGHVFHLSCLVLYNSESDDMESSNLALGGGENDPPDRRSFGAKTTRAKELRGKVGNGCPVTVHKDKA